MAITVGTGPDSWGVWFPSDPEQPPWEQYLDEAAEAGYEWTELGPIGYLPTDTDVLQAELEKRSLKLCGGFIMHHLEEEGAAEQVLGDIDHVSGPYPASSARASSSSSTMCIRICTPVSGNVPRNWTTRRGPG